MNEDPYQHLKEFHVVCSSMKPERVTEEQVKLRAFPFSLDGVAKEWLFYLPASSVTSWEGMMRLFLTIGSDSRSFVQVVHSMIPLNNLSFINFMKACCLP
ncbi:LRR receptor-like serine/threonine-protein kinase EFR [Senna tora]|uniref:LRR receptor-like serine/threonine-protein kinase EFR n=1 Tax=Senna tora TaxID=362788 RepID=A0A835CK91_9FABA|nr:LRR receptor-like serine/threonine-protein kinase EFR [Senna tora]